MIFDLSGLSDLIQQQIKDIVFSTTTTEITQNVFNVCIALIACAQKNMDLPIPIIKEQDTVDDMTSITTTVHPFNEDRIEEQKIMNQWLLKDMDHITVSRVSFDNQSTSLLSFFKHVRYEVESEKMRTKVYRRYNDFWWLSEILSYRYPFRLIPHLPPKKIGGRNLAFEEQRRKGLSRFINAVVRHPVLGKDDVVLAFLSCPSEFQNWKSRNSPSLDEEFVRKTYDIIYFERLIPIDLEDRIIRMKKRVSVTLQQYNHMYLVMNDMIKLKKALGADYIRYSLTLNSINALEKQCWINDCQDCLKVKYSYDNVVKSMHQAGMMLNRQAIATGNSILESLKQQKDLLESFKDLLERREKDNHFVHNEQILARQIAKYKKGQVISSLAHDEEQLEEEQEEEEQLNHHHCFSTSFDERTGGLSLIQQREIFIKFCLFNELSYFHKQQAYVSAMYNQYIIDELKYARQWNTHWKQLEMMTKDMPNILDDFL
ncbi:uncharacterized protein BX663DRAFT_485128 [Cokeromyces recurvatus]|uniref:uncharacterized protein n=1 Tax=Cokeromyces recurvatus TaxID=90255 RepID=UPI00221FC605|nr:uncharacterized protein BX663DRAFT_485128 [Cokeromyces recurvatus]KAI7904302.1 hypothetical protein BX663DRAFT_485128 [Cokeromyces recurvatus]